MSSWGNLDNVTIAGSVYIATANANAVLGVSTLFTSNVKQGDYITIASNKYQVEQVIDNTHLYLTSKAATNSAGVRAYVQQGPKYIANSNVVVEGAYAYSIQDIYGIDKNEVDVPENKARGISHTGWTSYKTYSTTQGSTRYKTETLVALSKNFAANSTGVLFGTNAGQDAADDTVAADYLIYFTTQPSAVTDAGANAATLTTVATSNPTGATLTYQWYKKDNASATVYSLAGGTGITGNTTNTLSIAKIANVSGNVFRLTISAAGTGADDNTSTAVAVTSS